MDGIEIYCVLIVGLMSIGLPILLQTITRIEDKYKVPSIADEFKKEPLYISFYWILVTCITLLLLYALNSIFIFDDPELAKYGLINIDIPLEKKVLTCFFILPCIALVILFFRLINLTFRYLDKEWLIRSLIQKDIDKQKDGNYYYFNALIRFYLVGTLSDEKICLESLRTRFYECFLNYRTRHPNKEEGYPVCFYELIDEVRDEILIRENKKLISIEYYVFSGIWLLGELKYNKIAEPTYNSLWQTLFFSIKYEKDEYVIFYWKNAFQYFQFAFSIDVENAQSMEEEKERFLEFNYALGGLLLRQERYNCLDQIFVHSNSIPSDYVLFPKTMTELFCRYFYFLGSPFPPSSLRNYSFPNTDIINLENEVSHWTCKYIACLFLRQYKLVKSYTYQHHVEVPTIPDSLEECKVWYAGIDQFKNQVKEMLNNRKALQNFKLDNYHTNKSYDSNHQIEPLNLFEQTKSALKNKIHEINRSAPLSKNRINQFRNKSKEIIAGLLDECKVLTITNNIDSEFDEYNFVGNEYPLSRFAFLENTGTYYANFDTFLASELIVPYFKQGLISIFTKYVKRRYLLSNEELSDGIKKLRLNQDYIVISFNAIDKNDEKILESKGIEIKYVDWNIYSVNKSCFIMKKCDLPSLEFTELLTALVSEYKLLPEDIATGLNNIYIKIVDYNNESGYDSVKEKVENSFLNDRINIDPDESVMEIIKYNAQFRFKKSIEITQILINTPFSQRGIPNRVEDIQPL